MYSYVSNDQPLTPPSQILFFNHPLLEIVAPDIYNLKSDYLSIYRKKIQILNYFSKKISTQCVILLPRVIYNPAYYHFYCFQINKKGMDRFNTPPIKYKENEHPMVLIAVPWNTLSKLRIRLKRYPMAIKFKLSLDTLHFIF